MKNSYLYVQIPSIRITIVAGMNPPPQRKKILIILYLTGFITMLGIGIITPVLPIYAGMIGASGFWIGAIFSVFALSRTIFMPFIGRISDKRGRRRYILLGLAGYTLFSALYVPANDVVLLTIVRFFHGIAAAMVYPIANAYVADIAEEGEEGRVMGGFQSAAFLGMSCGPLISGVIVDLFTISSAFLALAVLSLITLIICIIFLPEYHVHIREIPSLRSVFFSKGMRIPIIFFFTYTAAYTVFVVFLPVLANTDKVSVSNIGALIFIASISMALFQRISGKYADTQNRYLLLSGGAGIMALSLILFPMRDDLMFLLLFSALLGSGLGISLTTVSAMAVIEGRRLGQGGVEGVINTAQGIGIVVSPVVFGLIMDASNVSMVFLIAAAVSGVMALVMLLPFYFGSLHDLCKSESDIDSDHLSHQDD